MTPRHPIDCMWDDPGASTEPSQPPKRRTRKAPVARKPSPTVQTRITIASAHWTVHVIGSRVTVELR